MEPFPNYFPNFTADTFITLVFLLIAAIYVIFSAVLYYHWVTYSTEKKVMRITLLAYALSTLPLFLLLGSLTFFM